MKKALVVLALLALPFLAAQEFPPPSGPAASAVHYGTVKAITEGVDTPFATVEVPVGSFMGARIFGAVFCTDDATYVAVTRDWYATCINDAGAIACYVDDGSDYAEATSGGTITEDVDYTTGTNEVTFDALTTCSLTQTTLDWHWKIEQTPSGQQAVRLE